MAAEQDAAAVVPGHELVVPDEVWWWAVHLSITSVAIIANFLFILTAIYNRCDMRTFVSAVITVVAILDILDVLRVAPILLQDIYAFEAFRHAFCISAIFHELAVAYLITALAIYVCVESGAVAGGVARRKFGPVAERLRRSHTTSNSARLWHKMVIGVVIMLSLSMACPLLFMAPHGADSLTSSATCIDFGRVATLTRDATASQPDGATETEASLVLSGSDLYAVFVIVFTYVVPILVLPLAIGVATVRSAVAGLCCKSAYKQNVGELLLVILVSLVYLVTVVCGIFPRIDAALHLETGFGSTPLLWEMANNAIRPLIYFLVNPAVWDGLRSLCCLLRRRRQMSHDIQTDVENDVPASGDDENNNVGGEDEGLAEAKEDGRKAGDEDEAQDVAGEEGEVVVESGKCGRFRPGNLLVCPSFCSVGKKSKRNRKAGGGGEEDTEKMLASDDDGGKHKNIVVVANKAGGDKEVVGDGDNGDNEVPLQQVA